MGKLGVAGLTFAAAILAVLLPSRTAAAQDFGQSWIDRITHELQQERGPLQPKAFDWNAQVGLNYSFDSNIFLTNTSKKSDSIITPFVQAGFTYGEPRFDLEASILADYKIYAKEKADDDEERLYFRARQTASRWNFEISEILQNVSDPSGVLFLNRVSRLISNTIPKVAFDIGRSWAMELGGNIQIVRFKDEPYATGQENNNFSIDFAVVYRTPWAWDAVAQFGYYNINYVAPQTVGGTPDAFGYYYRVGFRGQLLERLTVEALVGYTTISTDFFGSTGNDINEGSLGAVLNIRYEATERINFFFDVARQYAFNGFGDPFQMLTTVTIYGKFELTQEFTLTARLQFDHSDSALDVTRNYYSAGVYGNYKVNDHLIVDGGLTYRGGKTENVGSIKFNDIILSVGIAYGW